MKNKLLHLFLKEKVKKNISLATLLIFGAFWLFYCFPALAAPGSDALPDMDSANAIHIKTVKDFQKFAENCSVDSWSRDKIFVLDKDIDLSRADFSPVPTFGGVFLGQGHTISGLTLEGGSNYIGLFRYIQESGQIYQLSVSGTAQVESTQVGLALLAGCNYGLLSGCETSGNVTGGDQVGSIAGLNEVTGVIADCSANGLVCGGHLVGGIAGENKGNITGSVNHSFVNTAPSDNKMNLNTSLSALNTDTALLDILSTENAASVTDIGGITGSNPGVIHACVNEGSVGYQHVGYNIGGIAGSQSGYIEGCVNYGLLNGRKDVGGIAGQMEPSSQLIFSEDTLQKLDREFDKLHDLFTQLDRDTSTASGSLTGQVDQLLNSVENAQNAVGQIMNDASSHMAEFSGLTDLASLPTPRPVSLDFLDKLPTPSFTPWPSVSPWASFSPWPTVSPWPVGSATPSATPAATESPTGTPSPAATNAPDVPDPNPDPDPDPPVPPVLPAPPADDGSTDETNPGTDIPPSSSADSTTTETVPSHTEEKGDILDTILDPSYAIPNYEENDVSVEQGGFAPEPRSAKTVIAAQALQAGVPADTGSDTVPGTDADTTNNNDGTINSNPDNGSGANSGGDPDKVPGDNSGDNPGKVPGDNSGSNPDSDSGDHTDETPTPDVTPSPSFTWPESFPTPPGNFDFDSLRDRIDKEQVEEDINKVQENVYEDASSVLENINRMVQDQAFILSSRISSAQASLSGSFSGIINDMRILNTMLDDENQIVLNDFQAIIDQINVITDIITNPQTTDPDDILTDVSDEDQLTDTTGKVMNCINNGKICGDLNAGGIAGSLSRENNLDPENDFDLTQDNATLNFRYQERIVVRQCRNKGAVEGRKNRIGGIAGEMTLGSIIECINEGYIAGEGNQIGGIAGYCASSIRASSAKCTLSGVNQIGGIAGCGANISDCYSMVEIKDGENFTGSIAGKTVSSSSISNNFFVKGGPDGIDGISYEEMAQPLAYEEFLQMPDLPEIFESISLSFVADGKTVSVVPLKYGDSFSPDRLPTVPIKEGYAGSWPEFDYHNITFDQTIEAVYTEYASAVESRQTMDGRPVALVEGSFAPEEGFTLSRTNAYPANARSKGECWKMSISETAPGPYTIRYLIPTEMENPELMVYDNNSWLLVDAVQDGSYYVFTSEQPEIIFCCTDQPASLSGKILVVLTICLIAAMTLLLILYRKKRSLSSKRSNAKEEVKK